MINDNIQVIEFQAKYTQQVRSVVAMTLEDLGINTPNPIRKDPDLDHILEIYKDRGRFWIALVNGEVVGTIALENKIGPTANLKRVFVLTPYQGKGIAQLLLEKAVNFAIENEYKVLELTSDLSMKRAHRFYEKHGFRKIAEDEKQFFYRLILHN